MFQVHAEPPLPAKKAVNPVCCLQMGGFICFHKTTFLVDPCTGRFAVEPATGVQHKAPFVGLNKIQRFDLQDFVGA